MAKKIKSSQAGKAVPIHLFLEEKKQGLSFHITEYMDETAIGPEAVIPHRHPFYSIIYVASANGRHYLDCDVYQNIKDTVFLIRPGQMHYWEGVTEISGKLIYFGEKFLLESSNPVNSTWETELIAEMITSGQHAIALPSLSKRVLEQLLSMMMKEYQTKPPRYTEVLRSYLNAFLIGVWRVSIQQKKNAQANSSQSTLGNEFQTLLGQHVKERLPMRYYADALGVSIDRFTRQIKKQTGFTPSELHRMAVINEAKRLLANTKMSVGEISEYLGFVDNAYFCRVFKRQTEISPGRFRQRCRSRHD